MANETEKARELIVYDFDPRNLPAEYLQAIGLVVAASAQTESTMQDFIGALLSIDNIDTLAVTTHLTAPVKDHIARTLAELKAPHLEDLDQIDDLLDAVNEAMEKRNVIVHNAFAIDPETKEIFSHRLKARGSLQLDFKPIKLDDIKETAAQVYDAGINLMRFMMAKGIGSNFRADPLRQPIARNKKARAERRAGAGAEPAAPSRLRGTD